MFRASSIRRPLALLLAAAGLLLAAAPLHAQTGGFLNTPAFSADGVAFVVFLGGSIEDLEAAASASSATGAWAQDPSGSFLSLTIGGPTFLNSRFRAAFGDGFAGPTAIVLTRARGTSSPGGTSTPGGTNPPAVGSWTTAAAPTNARSTSDEWIAIAAPDGKTILANVIRPAGAGPFPVVVLLHGQSGFSNDYLGLGQDIAAYGYVTVVGCWFAGNYDGNASTDDPAPVTDPDGIACPDGPSLKSLTSTDAIADIDAIAAAARTLPGVRSDRVGLVGNSRGSVIGILDGAIGTQSLQAIVGIGGAPPGGALLATQITEPVLLLQGEADSVIPVTYAQQLEAGLRALGRTVESHYYPQAGHGILFGTPYYTDVLARVAAFLDAQLED